jgi:hypothetical protein
VHYRPAAASRLLEGGENPAPILEKSMGRGRSSYGLRLSRMAMAAAPCAPVHALPTVQCRIKSRPLKTADLAIRPRQVPNGRGPTSRRQGARFVVVAAGAERSDPTETGSSAATRQALIATRHRAIQGAPLYSNMTRVLS